MGMRIVRKEETKKEKKVLFRITEIIYVSLFLSFSVAVISFLNYAATGNVFVLLSTLFGLYCSFLFFYIISKIR